MTRHEAKSQLDAFFEKLGNKDANLFEESNVARATIGEAFMGFVFNENKSLSCQSLIYRFRKMPKKAIMDAIESESTAALNGGGEIAFDEDNLSLILQKEYTDKVSNEQFYRDIQELAETSLIWSNEVLSRVAEKAYAE